MKIYVSLYFLFFFSLTILISCQQTSNQTEYFSNIEKNSLDQKQAKELEGFDLSLSTLTQQNIEKEKAAKKLEDARKERIEIEIDNSLNFLYYVNVAKFARDTKHNKGEKIFTRLSFSIYDNWNECSKFKSKDEAQRKFLKDGGPYKDRFNLDPDGDGFACDWDPEIYRKLSIPND